MAWSGPLSGLIPEAAETAEMKVMHSAVSAIIVTTNALTQIAVNGAGPPPTRGGNNDS
jgi:hypothetical protein